MNPVEHWQERFAAQGPSGIEAARRKALDHFAAEGFPGRRNEEWKYTNPARIAKTAWEAAPRSFELDRETLEWLSSPVFACSVFVFVDGRYVADLSAPAALGGQLGFSNFAGGPEEAFIDSVGSAVTPFGALNTAFFEDGAHVRIAKGSHIEEPIHLVFVNTGGDDPVSSHPRVRVEAAAGSHVMVIEDHVSLAGGATFTNGVTEIDVAENAAVDWIKIQREDPSTFHVSEMRGNVGRDARLSAATLSFGSALLRNDARVRLSAPGAHCDLRGLFVAGGSQLVDNHTWVDHAEPHCTSDELYKGILDGQARGVFNGRVVVRPDAQKTNAAQQNPNLLLSRDAEINTQPQLEIYADDVKCSHGSTVGQLDEASLFYLRSRGIPEHDARNLLMRGFVSEITSALAVPAIGARVDDLVVERLGIARDLPKEDT